MLVDIHSDHPPLLFYTWTRLGADSAMRLLSVGASSPLPLPRLSAIRIVEVGFL